MVAQHIVIFSAQMGQIIAICANYFSVFAKGLPLEKLIQHHLALDTFAVGVLFYAFCSHKSK